MIKKLLISLSLLSFAFPVYGADQVHEKRKNFGIFVKTLTGEAKNFEYEGKRTFENVMTSIFKHFKVPGRVIYGSTLLNEPNDQKELKNFAQKDQTLPFDAAFPTHMDLLYFVHLSRNPQANAENYYYGKLSLKDGRLVENGTLLEPIPTQQPLVSQAPQSPKTFQEFDEGYGNINKEIQQKNYEKAAMLLTSMSGKGQEDARYEETKKLLEDHGVQGFW